MDIREEKRVIRREALAARRSLTADERHDFSKRIQKQLFDQDEYLTAKCVFLYAAMEEEVHTNAIISDLLGAGKMVCLPYVDEERNMVAVRLRSIVDLVEGKFGILTVGDGLREVVDPEKISLVLVPGAAFTRMGDRIGMGGGFFDDYLPKATHAHRIGLTYSCQLVDHIPMEENDCTVEKIITENEVIECV